MAPIAIVIAIPIPISIPTRRLLQPRLELPDGLGCISNARGTSLKAERILERIRREQAAGAVVGVSAVTVSELEFGTWRSTQPVRERRAVTKVLAPFELFDYDAVGAPRHYGEIRAQLGAAGVPIGAMDLLIAAHARSLGAALVTHNTAEFSRIDGLRCENWAEPAAAGA